MRVLVTGAAGFLGRHFVKHHVAIGDEVLGVDNLSNQHSYWPKALPADQCVEDDAGTWFETAKSQYDLAYHFAAPVGGREKIELDPLFNADSLRLDSQFFRWAIGNVAVAVYPSSSAVYGVTYQNDRPSSLLEEMFSPASVIWPAPDEVYGLTKMVGEVLAYKAAKYGLSTLCIRPFSGYGEDQSLEYPVPSICRRAHFHENPLLVWGSGKQKRDFVHVDDLVGATSARLARGIDGYQALNIGSGKATDFITVAKMAAEIQGYDPRIVTDISKPVGVAARWADVTRMNEYYKPTITLKTGLARVLEGMKHAKNRRS